MSVNLLKEQRSQHDLIWLCFHVHDGSLPIIHERREVVASHGDRKQISHAVDASLDVCHLVKLEDEPQDLATFEVLFLEGILFLLKVDSATKFTCGDSRKGGIELGIK